MSSTTTTAMIDVPPDIDTEDGRNRIEEDMDNAAAKLKALKRIEITESLTAAFEARRHPVCCCPKALTATILVVLTTLVVGALVLASVWLGFASTDVHLGLGWATVALLIALLVFVWVLFFTPVLVQR